MPTQGAGKGSSCGALVGIPISSVIQRDSEWQIEREHLGYVCNPCSLKEERRCHVHLPQLLSHCWAVGLGSSAKAWINVVHLLPLISGSWMQITTCQSPLANLVTLEVDRSLCRDPNFVGHPTWRLFGGGGGGGYPPWPPESPDPPWPPYPPWSPGSPDPPWPPESPDPPWVPERAPPWRPPVRSPSPWGLQSAHPPSPFDVIRRGTRLLEGGGG